VRKNLALLKTSIDVIRRTFAAHQSSTDLDNLAALLGKIIALIDPHAAASATDTASQADESNAQRAREDGGFAKSADPPPTSIAEAAQALAAIADYYSRSEPSSPILPLVRQAHQLIGKSFLEVITILMPSQVEKAAFQIGTEQVFDLPVGKLSELSGVSAAPSTDASSDSSPSAQATDSAQPRYSIRSRTQALALLELVQRYFRHAEPSSPIPMLCERARALAQRDFMGVLRDVLPKSALKALDTDKA
jgi:type VI secretion system protein ImpA